MLEVYLHEEHMDTADNIQTVNILRAQGYTSNCNINLPQFYSCLCLNRISVKFN